MVVLRTILPFEPAHLAGLMLQQAQTGEARFGIPAGTLAEHGPAFTAAEIGDDGAVIKVLACAGLAENVPPSAPGGGHATAWATFPDGLRPAEWSFVTQAIRGVLDGCGYGRVDMVVSAGFAAAQRYAEALGFQLDGMIYARTGGQH